MQQNESITKMPRLNKDFTIIIDGDVIMKKMLDLLPEDFKHREVLAHAIVGSGIEAGNISYIYNALSGFTNDIDFKEGDDVICTESGRYEEYDANEYHEDGSLKEAIQLEGYKPNLKYRNVEISNCRVISVNLYTTNKLLVEFDTVDKYSGKKRRESKWVDHKKCSFVQERATKSV